MEPLLNTRFLPVVHRIVTSDYLADRSLASLDMDIPE